MMELELNLENWKLQKRINNEFELSVKWERKKKWSVCIGSLAQTSGQHRKPGKMETSPGAHENQNQEHQNEKTRQGHSDPGRSRPVRVGEGDGPWGETRRYGEGRGEG